MNRNGPTVSADRERTYLCWVNSKLSRLRPPVVLQALDEERVTNGTALADLLNVLSGSQLTLKVPCLSRDDRIENIALLLKRLRELRVPVQSIREEDVADGEKNTIARLLLSISASFMPNHVHDVKHELQDRGARTLSANKTHNHAVPATTTCWRMADHACSASMSKEQPRQPPERWYIQRPVFRFQPVAMHRLVPSGPRSGSLSGGGGSAANGLQHCNHKTLLLSSAGSSNAPLGLLLRPSTSLNSFTYRQSSSATPQLFGGGGCGGSGSDAHIFGGGESVCGAAASPDCQYLRTGGSKVVSPMRAAKSLSALHSGPRRYVSRLFIPNLRQEAAIAEDCPKANGHAARAPNKCVEAVRSRTSSVASDGYVNHGFVDSPRANNNHHNHHHPAVPLRELAAFHRDLVSVRSDLLRLQEMLSVEEPSTSLAVAATATPSTDWAPNCMQLTEAGMNALHLIEPGKPVSWDMSDPSSEQSHMPRIPKSRTDSFTSYPNETSELRNALLELTSAMKRLQAENNELRQNYQVSHTPGSLATQSSRTSGLRNWSFSSESLSYTPCSPCDTAQHYNDALNSSPALI